MRLPFFLRDFLRVFVFGLFLRFCITGETSNPAFVDGIGMVLDSVVSNQNLGVDYLYSGDALGQEGVHNEVADPAGQMLGSHTQATGRFKGNVDFQLVGASDAVPRPGDIQLFRGGYYKVAGAIGPKRTKNKAVMVSVPLENVLNPLITTCITSNGQIFTDTFASGGSSYTKTFASANTRTGATKAWSIEAWTDEYPAATVPSGMTINASTGVLTYTTPAAGTYYIKVKLSDTAAAGVPTQPVRTGVGFLILVIT